MPAPYASLFGGLLLLGVLVYSIWTQTQTPQREDRTRHNFNPGAGYDRPRNADWENEDNPNNTEKKQKRKSKKPLCEECDEPLEGHSLKRFPCKHIFHAYCVQGIQTCPSC